MTPADRIAWIRGRCPGLTERGVRLVAALAGEEGVSFQTIRQRIWPHSWESKTNEHVRDAVRRTLPRLPPGVTITSIPGSGYIMKGWAAWLQRQF